MKKLLIILCMFVILINGMNVLCFAEEQAVIDLACPSAILMERSTGEVLYTKDADTSRPLASVTKIMTLLLIMEAIDNDKVQEFKEDFIKKYKN